MEDISIQPKIYTITEITRSIKNTLEGKAEYNNVWIKGEIYNLTFHSSGHIYFTLKDKDAVISAVFFKYANRKCTVKLKEGMAVLALGNITVFEKRGSYQINVSAVKLEGIGELQKKIEELKKKLASEGIFDESNKKPIPFLPMKLGIVTSPTGAAVRDIIKVALRRYPNMEIVVAPAKVQGDDAPETIVRGIEELNRQDLGIDVIIAGRGGGSFEDLMPFNEEIVVRAFFESRVPIISAVGHQIDHPLSDAAADLAAPTPSAAAELAIPVKKDLAGEIEYILVRAQNSLFSQFQNYSVRLDSVVSRRVFRDPFEIINDREMLLSDLEGRTVASMRELISKFRQKFLSVPDITMMTAAILNKFSHRYNMAVSALEQLSPLSVMKRGYSVTLDEKGALLKSVNTSAAGDRIKVLLSDGTLSCTIDSTEKGGYFGKEKSITK